MSFDYDSNSIGGLDGSEADKRLCELDPFHARLAPASTNTSEVACVAAIAAHLTVGGTVRLRMLFLATAV